MAALFKYFVGIAVILPVVMFVMVLSAVNMGEMFVGIAAITQTPATETARWNIGQLMAETDRRAWIIKPDLSGNSRQRAFGKTSVHRASANIRGRRAR